MIAKIGDASLSTILAAFDVDLSWTQSGHPDIQDHVTLNGRSAEAIRTEVPVSVRLSNRPSVLYPGMIDVTPLGVAETTFPHRLGNYCTFVVIRENTEGLSMPTSAFSGSMYSRISLKRCGECRLGVFTNDTAANALSAYAFESSAANGTSTN